MSDIDTKQLIKQIDLKMVWTIGSLVITMIIGGAFLYKDVQANTRDLKERKPLVQSVPEIKKDIEEIRHSQAEQGTRLRRVETNLAAQTAILERIDRKLP